MELSRLSPQSNKHLTGENDRKHPFKLYENLSKQHTRNDETLIQDNLLNLVNLSNESESVAFELLASILCPPQLCVIEALL